MKYPKFIQLGSTIGIPSPSAGGSDVSSKNRLRQSQKYFISQGFHLLLSKNLFNCQNGRSSSAEIRASEMNEMFSSKDIDFILCCLGGDFLIEILPFVNFNLLIKNPKFVAGFSDPTGILYPLTTKYDIATIYGHNFIDFGALNLHKSEIDFIEYMKGNLLIENNYSLYQNNYLERITGLEGYNLTDKVFWKTLNNKSTHFRGRIIGGCFYIISELAGTKYDGFSDFYERYKEDGIIWYFDNCELSMEETIRVLWKFEQLGYFKKCVGVIFGRFGKLDSYYGYDTKGCLNDSILKNLSIPIVYDADISHKGLCLTIINGAIATVDVKNGTGKISFELT